MKREKLTEAEWLNVFKLRCRTRRGERLTDPETDLVERAHVEDRERYRALDKDVFEETLPVGSTARWKP